MYDHFMQHISLAAAYAAAGSYFFQSPKKEPKTLAPSDPFGASNVLPFYPLAKKATKLASAQTMWLFFAARPLGSHFSALLASRGKLTARAAIG